VTATTDETKITANLSLGFELLSVVDTIADEPYSFSFGFNVFLCLSPTSDERLVITVDELSIASLTSPRPLVQYSAKKNS